MTSRDRAAIAARGLVALALAGTVATLLFAAHNGLAPTQRPTTFGAVLWPWFVTAWILGGFVPLLVATFAASRLRGRWRWTGLALALLFVAVTLVGERAAVADLASLGGPQRFRLLAPAGVILSLLSCVVLAAPGWGRLRLVAPVVALLAAAGALLPGIGASRAGALPGPPGQGPLGLRHGDEDPLAREPGGGGSTRPSEPLLLVGIDGADWRYARPLMERGLMPNLQGLVARGAHGPLRSMQPTLSPVIWTTVATGLPPEQHGVQGFMVERLAGVGRALPELRHLRLLGSTAVVAHLRRTHRIVEGPVGSDVRRVPAYWNIASARGVSTVLVNWWATWPAEPVRGAVVSERAYFERLVHRDRPPTSRGTTSPEALYHELGGWSVMPDELSIERAQAYFEVEPAEYDVIRSRDAPPGVLHEFTYFVAAFDSDRRIAVELVRRHRGADVFVLLRLVDKMSHAALRHSDLVPGHDPSRPADARFAQLVTRAYHEADAALGDLLREFGDGNVIVMSDHGFDVGSGARRRARHDDAPDGIFVGAGPAFRPGEVRGAGVIDMLPLLLRLKGFPVAEDMPGKVPATLLTEEFLKTRPETRVASYGTQESPRLTQTGSRVDQEIVEKLRALGYIRY